MLVYDVLSIFGFLAVDSVLSLFGVGQLSEHILFFGLLVDEVGETGFWIFVCDCEFVHELASLSEGIAAWGAHYKSNQILILVTVTLASKIINQSHDKN